MTEIRRRGVDGEFVLTEDHLSVVQQLEERITAKDAEIAELRSENERLKARNTELEAVAEKWATNAPLSERRALHEASVAYRKAAGIFPNPDGVKAILDK